MHTDEILLTTDEVEERYKIDKGTQKRYRTDGTWPYMRPSGRRIYYRESMISAWVEAHMRRDT